MEQLKHRTRDQDPQEQQRKRAQESNKISDTKIMNDAVPSVRRGNNRRAMAKRGLRSLCLAVALPVSFTIVDILLFGSNLRYATMKKPFWIPPLWALHSACLTSAFLMGLSAWLVWAEGGFHRQPSALFLYLGELALALAWYPMVFRAGASKIGLVMCVAIFGALVGCIRMFRSVNPIAGDLFKPCLLWALLLSIVNLRLVYH